MGGGWLGNQLSGLFIFLRSPIFPEFLFPLLFLVPRGLGWTLGGALIAPRRRIVPASVLAVVCLSLSVNRHILTQRELDLTRYMHATGESLGALTKVVIVAYLVMRPKT